MTHSACAHAHSPASHKHSTQQRHTQRGSGETKQNVRNPNRPAAGHARATESHPRLAVRSNAQSPPPSAQLRLSSEVCVVPISPLSDTNSCTKTQSLCPALAARALVSGTVSPSAVRPEPRCAHGSRARAVSATQHASMWTNLLPATPRGGRRARAHRPRTRRSVKGDFGRPLDNRRVGERPNGSKLFVEGHRTDDAGLQLHLDGLDPLLCSLADGRLLCGRQFRVAQHCRSLPPKGLQSGELALLAAVVRRLLGAGPAPSRYRI
mmetsp:Transcript_41613/g.114592  ORF Transcript_41613/g.114592 Transcript_41613/m.114592 type:complete len:265 (+) Transcript_41613:76-870(+)